MSNLNTPFSNAATSRSPSTGELIADYAFQTADEVVNNYGLAPMHFGLCAFTNAQAGWG